jgi:cobyrinic acid a,c-diamide synthase
MDKGVRQKIPRLVIAAPSSGSGKTTFSMGLMAAFCRRGLKVQPFKVGPDYIDPAFHTRITGRNSINLDGWMLEEPVVQQLFVNYSQGADLSIVEGVMGLYDGYGEDPMMGSTAGMAKILQAPVILVMAIDAMAASAAAIAYGLKEFGPVNLKGVVINKPSSLHHYQIVKDAIEKYAGIQVLGYLPKTAGIELKSRHLGLVQSSETKNLPEIVDSLADLIEENVDLDLLLKMANETSLWEFEAPCAPEEIKEAEIKIAVAQDQAFSFYYHENLTMLRRLGAELVFFSPIQDKSLPQDCCGVYIGGGYPEVFAPEISANTALMQNIKEKAEQGMPIYGECGGYMYLNKKFTNDANEVFPFVGIFEGEATMTNKLQNFGYLELQGLTDTVLFNQGERIKAHEFHKSIVLRTDDDFCIQGEKVKNGQKIEWHCGRKYKNVFGMYPHVYFPANEKFAGNFVKHCREYAGLR